LAVHGFQYRTPRERLGLESYAIEVDGFSLEEYLSLAETPTPAARVAASA
jgi:hypothetical protein